MIFSRTLLWSSALAGSLLLTLGSMTGCGGNDANDNDDVAPSNDDDGKGSSSSGSNTSSGSTHSGSSSSGGDAGVPISIPQNAIVHWTSSGGAPNNNFEPCVAPSDEYTYILEGRSLTWSLCRPDSVDPKPVNGRLEGDATLTAEQDAMIRKALSGVVPNTALQCDADRPTAQLELVISENNGGDTHYYDQAFHCSDDGRTFVDGLAPLGEAFERTIPTGE